MIPKVSANVILSTIGQEERDWKAYIKESVALLKERQPILHETLFASIQTVLNRYFDGKDRLEVTQYKINAIVALGIRCIYNQDEVNELEEMFND